jgi:hypothetical protein
MIFFLYTHFIEYFILLPNPKFVKIMHHTEVFTNISTFQLAGKIEGHKPADDITGVGNDFPYFPYQDFDINIPNKLINTIRMTRIMEMTCQAILGFLYQ